MTRQTPLPFSAEMMRAHLAGLKTETRRVAKIKWRDGANPEFTSWRAESVGSRHWQLIGGVGVGANISAACKPGDLIWATETWRTWGVLDNYKPSMMNPAELVQYDADGSFNLPAHPNYLGGKTRVSIHMPKWASRLTLRVTEVAVERLQDISAESCKREGVEPSELAIQIGGFMTAYRNAYCSLWGRINGPGAWAQNPWVVVYRYEPIWQNVMEVAA